MIGVGVSIPRLGLLRSAAEEVTGLTLVGAGATAKILSSNSLNVDYPTGIQAGDLLVLHVMHRSALTTPSGWTLKRTSDATTTATQQSSVLVKTAVGSESGTLTINQATGARFMGQITAIRGEWAAITGQAGVVNGDPAGFMSTGAIAVSNGWSFASVSYVTTHPSDPVTNSVESGWTLDGTATQSDNRLAVAHRDCSAGHSESEVDFSQSYSTATDHTWTTLRIETELGAELITNGTFNSGISNWTAQSGANLVWTSNALEVTNDPADGFSGAYQTISTTSGRTYVISVDVLTSTNRTSIRVNDGSSPGDSQLSELNVPVGSQSYTFTAASSQSTVYLVTQDNGATSIFDNVSVKEIL